MPEDINEVEFTIFDTETTGLEPESGDRIVEVAAVKFKGSIRISSFQTLVDPGRPISDAAFSVNQITAQMLQGAPKMHSVLPGFLDFIRGSCLCSYNAGFDLRFLNYELSLAKAEALEDIVAVDILKMARRLLPGLERYALWFVADKLGIKTAQKHRALSDVELTWEVFEKLKEILAQKGIVDFKNFTGLFGVNARFLSDIQNQKVSEIQKAINLGVKLKIKYLATSNAAVTVREVVPAEIKYEKDRAYLVAHCFLRNQERWFNIDGILHLEIV